jgi:SAM-dependent methyltransferase
VTDPQTYFEYLRQRSWRALLFRRLWLYPRLCRSLRGRVLDVGCGIGDLLRYRPDTVGVDINPVTVAWCKEQGLDARIMEPDRLPFENGEFGGAVLDNVLEHLEHPMPLLAEIRRVTVPGAVLIVAVPGSYGYTIDADHKVFYDERGLVALMQRAGFTKLSRFYVPFRSAWLERRMRQYCLYGVFRRERD